MGFSCNELAERGIVEVHRRTDTEPHLYIATGRADRHEGLALRVMGTAFSELGRGCVA